MFLNPDHLIRAYYESLGKLASPAEKPNLAQGLARTCGGNRARHPQRADVPSSLTRKKLLAVAPCFH